MRIKFLRALFLLPLLLLSSNASANDTFETADSIEVGSIFDASIEIAGDIDFYQFTVTNTSTYYFFSRGQTTDVQGQLFNANQQSIESDSSDGEGNNFRIVETPVSYTHLTLPTIYSV